MELARRYAQITQGVVDRNAIAQERVDNGGQFRRPVDPVRNARLGHGLDDMLHSAFLVIKQSRGFNLLAAKLQQPQE
jgi:hypothetical protein